MIVKNEAPVIERCLRSVRPFIHSWAIVDTGSGDGTQQLIRSALVDLPGELEEHPWVDFATSRNQALQLARRYGDYALFVDADDTLEVADPAALSVLDAHLYAVESRVRGVSGWNPFLARLDVDWQAPSPTVRRRAAKKAISSARRAGCNRMARHTSASCPSAWASRGPLDGRTCRSRMRRTPLGSIPGRSPA